MTAGVPGSGIGGIFYLLSALLMPVNECVCWVRGRSTAQRWRNVLRQTINAVGVIIGIWAMGLFLGSVVHSRTASLSVQSQVHAEAMNNFVRIAALFFALTTLLCVILCVQIMGMIACFRNKK